LLRALIVVFFSPQPVGFVTFSTRADAEAAMEDLQVGSLASTITGKAIPVGLRHSARWSVCLRSRTRCFHKERI